MGDTAWVNIGPRERRRRLITGVVALALGVAFVAYVWTTGWPRVTRLAATIFFLAGFTGIFQTHAKTCVALASRGLRNLDAGPELIEDAGELAAVRAQASRVLARSLLATALVGAAALALP